MIVHNAICGRASEAWVLWEGVTKFIYALRPDLNVHVMKSADGTSSQINRLEQFGLLSSSQATGGEDRQSRPRGGLDSIARVFWSTLQFGALAWLAFRSFVMALMRASSSLRAQESRDELLKTSDKVRISANAGDYRPSPHCEGSERRPVVEFRVWTCISRLTSIEQRMPWLSGFISFFQWLGVCGPGQLCSTNSTLDRYVSLCFFPSLASSTMPVSRFSRLAVAGYPATAKSRMSSN